MFLIFVVKIKMSKLSHLKVLFLFFWVFINRREVVLTSSPFLYLCLWYCVTQSVLPPYTESLCRVIRPNLYVYILIYVIGSTMSINRMFRAKRW